MTGMRPAVGSWYQDTEQGSLFEVVACDFDDETIEIQHLEGEIEEFDLDAWGDMPIQAVAPPEDWRTGYELSREDAVDPNETVKPQEDWNGAVDRIDVEDLAEDVEFWDDD